MFAKQVLNFGHQMDRKTNTSTCFVLQEWQTEVQQVNSLFSEAEMFGKEIIDFNKKKPVVEDMVNEKLKEVKEPLDDIFSRLDDREKKLKDQLQECGALHDQFDDFERRIKKLDDRITQQNEKPLSSKPGRLAVTLGEIEVSSVFVLLLLL